MLTALDRRLRAAVPPGPVAVTRVGLGAALAIVSVESSAALSGIASGRLAYPVVDWAPAPTSLGAVAVLTVGWLSAVCLLVGLLPGLTSLLGAGTGLVTLLWDQQLYSSHLVLLTVLLGLLAFAESDRRWAVSRRRYRSTGGAPFWPQLLMMTQVSVVYLFAGLSKAQPTFLSGEPLAGWMWITLPSWAYVVLAYLAVATEVSLAIALWLPRLRPAAVVVGASLHLSIIIMLEAQTPWLVAFTLTTVATYPLFLTRPPLGTMTARQAEAAQAPLGG